MDQLCAFLKTQVEVASQSENIKQLIWRTLVAGWYKFARNAKASIELLTLFIKHSKTTRAKKSLEK